LRVAPGAGISGLRPEAETRAGEAGNILGNRLDVVLSTRSSHSAADVDTQLSGVHGAGSWATATGFPSETTIAGAVWSEALSGAFSAGEAGRMLDELHKIHGLDPDNPLEVTGPEARPTGRRVVGFIDQVISYATDLVRVARS